MEKTGKHCIFLARLEFQVFRYTNRLNSKDKAFASEGPSADGDVLVRSHVYFLYFFPGAFGFRKSQNLLMRWNGNGGGG